MVIRVFYPLSRQTGGGGRRSGGLLKKKYNLRRYIFDHTVCNPNMYVFRLHKPYMEVIGYYNHNVPPVPSCNQQVITGSPLPQ